MVWSGAEARARGAGVCVATAVAAWPAMAWAHLYVEPHVWALLFISTPLVLGLPYVICAAPLIYALRARLFPDGEMQWSSLGVVYLISMFSIIVGLAVGTILALFLGSIDVLSEHAVTLVGGITLTTPLIWLAAWLAWRLRARK